MKIGIYDPYIDTLGGGEKYVLTAAECLASSHSVYIFWNNPQDIKQAEKKFNLNLGKVNIYDNIFSPKISLIEKLKQTKTFDAILYLSDGSIPFILAKKLIIHFQFPVEWVNTKSLLFKLKKSRINKIICNSYFTKNYIDKKFNAKSVVIYPPVEVSLEHENLHKENYILTVGRYNKLPNGKDFKKQSVLIDVFKEMVDHGLKNWELKIVISNLERDKKYVDELERIINHYPVKIYRNIENKEISNLYQKAKIYWHAAGFGEDFDKYPERTEHFGISTAEAMFAGCVPVVINAGGQKEIVKNNLNGYLWENTVELINKTKLLIKDQEVWFRLSQDARSSAEKFNKQRFCKEINSIFEP